MSVVLFPQQNVVVTVSGTDVHGNGAPLTEITADIDNHAMAYVVVSGNQATVVTLGTIGSFNLIVNAKDVNGVVLPAQSLGFQTEAGPAVGFNLAAGTVQNDDITTPPKPAGW